MDCLPFLTLLSHFLLTVVYGQEDKAEGPDPWVTRPPSHPDVSSKVVFPDSLDKRE